MEIEEMSKGKKDPLVCPVIGIVGVFLLLSKNAVGTKEGDVTTNENQGKLRILLANYFKIFQESH